jgi:hypothetical protein
MDLESYLGQVSGVRGIGVWLVVVVTVRGCVGKGRGWRVDISIGLTLCPHVANYKLKLKPGKTCVKRNNHVGIDG